MFDKIKMLFNKQKTSQEVSYTPQQQAIPLTHAEVIDIVIPAKKLFIEVLREYIDRYVVENHLGAETRKHYENKFGNYSLFVATNNLRDLVLEDLKIKHAEMFRGWLFTNLPTCSLRHASRHIELLKRATKYAVTMEYCVNDFLSPIKGQRDKPKNIVYLETHELKKLQQKVFAKGLFRIVADLFLFQCYTGLSYSDLWQHKIVDKNGRLWIEGYRTKSQEEYKIYFFDEARVIYDRYKGVLPQISNQKYNEYLKEIASILEINKKLTTHVGRKTHATLLHERGVSTETISVQLGNTERVCNESYIRRSHVRIETELHKIGITNSMLN